MFKIETGENNQILREKASEIKEKDYKEAIILGKKMVKFLKDKSNGGIGLAAPQIGKSIRLIAVGLPKNWDDETYKIIMMINPIITEYSEEKEFDEEGCLSVPKGERGNIGRYCKIRVEFIDENKKKQALILEGLSARVVQHEIDHLNGILYTDYLK